MSHSNSGNDCVQHGWYSDLGRLPEASLYQFVQFRWSAVVEGAVKRGTK
jgi:hypothetical protein